MIMKRREKMREKIELGIRLAEETLMDLGIH